MGTMGEKNIEKSIDSTNSQNLQNLGRTKPQGRYKQKAGANTNGYKGKPSDLGASYKGYRPQTRRQASPVSSIKKPQKVKKQKSSTWEVGNL